MPNISVLHYKHLRNYMLYTKFSKYEFWLEFLTFLGHVVSGEGINVDPTKVEVIRGWPRPTSVIEVRTFVRFAGYYRRFVEYFSTIVALLN